MSSADSCVLKKSSGVAEGRIRTQVTQILKSGQKIKNKLLKEDSSQLYQWAQLILRQELLRGGLVHIYNVDARLVYNTT